MGLGPQRKDSKTFGTTVYGLTHPNVRESVELDEKPFFTCRLSDLGSLLDLVSQTVKGHAVRDQNHTRF